MKRLWQRYLCITRLHKGRGTAIPHTYACPHCGREWSVVVW